ncbi:MAG: sulfatase-like hydrolase/transferase [Rhodopirellula sp. JB044]|uniref:sulfatase-like hydrolase/transferase n=1 Tax=Rhodopirellula sp. JB044 TaxID=3342844 RepID=UPI00370CD852
MSTPLSFRSWTAAPRRVAGITGLVIVTAMSICAAQAADSRQQPYDAVQPNVVVIMADDLGYADVGFQGCQDIRTPNIDQLASSGARFTQGYVTGCMCGPSRAGFLTGRIQSSFGYYVNASRPLDPAQGFPADIKTIAHRMQEQGYVTGGVGKWHMGTANHQRPNAMGYSDWYGFYGGGLMYYPLHHPSYDGRYRTKTKPWSMRDMHHTLPMLHNGKPVDWDQYLTRELTDGGIRFIEKNREQPFFLFVSYNAPHEYLEAPAETIEKYPPESMTKVPGVPAENRSVYAAMVDEMDQGIGRILQTLDRLELRDNTVVWFLSDHGGMKRTSDNRPLRGAKGNAYEGGLRVPFVVRWPNRIQPGTVLDHPVTSLDIGATSLSLAGADVDKLALHGRDISEYITGKTSDAPHQELYWHVGKGRKDLSGVLREGDYKMLVTRGRAELYDLRTDPTESHDLAKAQPQRAKRMLAKWKSWNESNEPPLWNPNQQSRNQYQYADYEWLRGTPHYQPD